MPYRRWLVSSLWHWLSVPEEACSAESQLDRVEIQLPARHDQLETVGNEITKLFSASPAWSDEAFNVQLAVHEACANVIDHAYQGSNQTFDVRLQLDKKSGRFYATIRDSGRPYQPNQDPSADAPLWRPFRFESHHGYRLHAVPEPGFDQIRGRGLFLMYSLVDDVIYFVDTPYNHWVLKKQFNASNQ